MLESDGSVHLSMLVRVLIQQMVACLELHTGALTLCLLKTTPPAQRIHRPMFYKSNFHLFLLDMDGEQDYLLSICYRTEIIEVRIY